MKKSKNTKISPQKSRLEHPSKKTNFQTKIKSQIIPIKQIHENIKLVQQKYPKEPLKKSMLCPDTIYAIQAHFKTWTNAKKVLNIKGFHLSNRDILNNFKKAFANKDKNKAEWRLQCKYAIDRFGSMEVVYKKAKITREHRDESLFLKNFKKAYLERKRNKATYKIWRTYSQKAFNRYRSLSTAYEKAGINQI